jgi:type VI protein secretion system component VasF
MARHDRAIAMAQTLPLTQASDDSRARLRMQSLSWAMLGGFAAGLMGLPAGLESALRSAGCGFFYGLLAFHLQRVDPDDSHLQAGLVGAVCGIRSLGSASLDAWPVDQPWPTALARVAPPVMMELLQAWLPLIGAALLLHTLLHTAHLLAPRPHPPS